MKKILPFLFFIPFFSFSQNLDILLANSKEIDPYRYKEVKGSPYFFLQFVTGNIISNGAETFANLDLNYNGETQEFEIIKEGKIIQLDKSIYMRVEVNPEDNPELNLEFPVIFQRGFSINWLKRFGQMVYSGSRIKFIKDFSVEVSVNEVQDVGKTIKYQRFAKLEGYYFLIEGKLIPVKLRKKKILKEIGNEKELEKYILENQLDIETETGLRKLLVYYDTLN